MSKVELIPVGRITGVHGIKGEIKVSVYGDLDDFEWTSVFITGKTGSEERKVERVRPHKGALIFALKGCSTRNAAEELVGLELAIPKAELPALPEDEYYYSELLGMEVWTEDGRLLGTVTNLFPTGSNDVIEVRGEAGEVLIPAIEDTVLKVDLEKRRVTVRLMEGLLPDEK